MGSRRFVLWHDSRHLEIIFSVLRLSKLGCLCRESFSTDHLMLDRTFCRSFSQLSISIVLGCPLSSAPSTRRIRSDPFIIFDFVVIFEISIGGYANLRAAHVYASPLVLPIVWWTFCLTALSSCKTCTPQLQPRCIEGTHRIRTQLVCERDSSTLRLDHHRFQCTC